MKSVKCALVTLAALSACGRGTSEEGATDAEPPAQEVGVKFREGKGLEVTEATQKILDISLAEVTEGTLSLTLTRSGHVFRYDPPPGVVNVSAAPAGTTGHASLVVPSARASGVKPGSSVTVGDRALPGTVTEVRRLGAGLAEDAEVLVEFRDPDRRYEIGSPVTVTIHGEGSDAPALIPRAALLETVNGDFVYVPNGKYYFRTAVKVGRRTDEVVEILDGLYPGDQVVKSPVTSLWLAELQALRGGVACADGH